MKLHPEIREMIFADRAFCELFADAIAFALLSRTPPVDGPRPHVFARTSVLLTVFAVEGAMNGLLDEHVPSSDRLGKRFERLPLIEKAELVALARARRRQFEAATDSFADIQELIIVRNRQVHPKTVEGLMVRRSDNESLWERPGDTSSRRLDIPTSHRGWNFHTACKALQVADSFLESFLLDVCGLDSKQVGAALLSGVEDPKGAWVANVMQKDHFPTWEKAKEHCGVRLKFFAGHDQMPTPSTHKSGDQTCTT